MIRLIVAFLFIFLSSTILSAHDQKYHKGKPTVGEIVSLSEQGFQMITKNGPLMVIITEKTKFEICDANASQEDLVAGTKLKIYGTKLPGKKVAAREILLDGNRGDHKR